MDRDNDDRDAPEFVKKYKQMLARKRKVADNMRGTAADIVDGGDDYFDYSTANVSAVVVKQEVIHVGQISSLYFGEHWELRNDGNTRLFKECDANWLFFYTIALQIKSRPSSITPRLSVKLGQESWPFSLIIKVDELYHVYKPKSDFLVLKFDLPRMAVEVNSTLLGQSAVDHHRMMIQGASVVRFANTTLDTYKNEKNFVFVAIYISGNGQADRYLLYQKKGSNQVFRNLRTFVFENRGDRIAFALELYNFCSALADESDSGDTGIKVKKLATSVENFRNKHSLPAFTGKSKTGKSKRTANDDEEDQPKRRVRPKGGDEDAAEQLEAYGYQVVPDILETEGGTWELIDKLPPNIRTVYRQSDRNKTELIAKHLRKRSKELDILKYLRTIRPQSRHIISFIETIPSNTGGWLILPKLRSIRYQELMDSRGVRGRDQLGRGLIEGLGYLHEHGIAHRDIKPDNLVCDDDFCLQIIDFDVAIQVQDENTEVDEYRGTRDWTAPEMGEEDGPPAWYSPIKADRWSCGRVLLRHILVGKGDNRLSRFAERLMSTDPQQRPSLLARNEWSAVPLSDMANVLKVSVKESRPRQYVDGGMNPPYAKRPRVAVMSEVFSQS
ncbi:kinase-like domain-containing protein [Lactarius akahatsu]|uniref:Kinase-like domain-containing protein n=1 Tax=Lactarius akahatsu TaxID=416441 RepID=A0AAD4Q6W7_9AGAM|nr:kinase-like domain-containing protein [Lactarius akahatsu]